MKHRATSLLLAISAALTAPGAVPVRRLNRYEYNCTVRDLLGVDFRANDDFPADNFSYGFDNNAATLTVTPALLAKYLNAAKKIARAAIEPVPPPATPELESRANASAAPDFTWRRNFVWDGDYDLHVSIAGRSDPFALYVAVDHGAPESLPVSVDFEGRRYADTRLNIGAGNHRLRVFAIRDDDRAVEQAWAGEAARARKTGAAPPSKLKIWTGLMAGTLPDFAGRVAPPYPANVTARGPYGLVLPAIPAGYALVFSCGHAPGQHNAACLRRNLENLARRAWRRPATPAEIDKLIRLVAGQPNLQQQMETGVEAILVSPSFLFHVEHAGAAGGSDFELASRLSYFLWSSMPDDELYRAAQRRQLSDPAVLAAQARRMLADPKSSALAENFAAQWLEFRNLDFIHRDPERFPQFTNDLRDAMRQETELFVVHVLHDDRSILDFLGAKYTFANEMLAKLYGVPGVAGDGFREVDLSGTARVGILTQASVLTVTSYATRTSPVLRGKWILENILNEPPPPPPANVPALRDSSTEPGMTLRQQLEQHRANPACAGCHARMDALGFGLENFDAIGRWQERQAGKLIDASGTLPGGASFDGPVALKRLLLARKTEFARSMVSQLLTYALGRGLIYQDDCVIADALKALERDAYRFSAMVVTVVTSYPFTHRRNPGF